MEETLSERISLEPSAGLATALRDGALTERRNLLSIVALAFAVVLVATLAVLAVTALAILVVVGTSCGGSGSRGDRRASSCARGTVGGGGTIIGDSELRTCQTRKF